MDGITTDLRSLLVEDYWTRSRRSVLHSIGSKEKGVIAVLFSGHT